MFFLRCLAVFIIPLFAGCIDVQKPLLRNAQPYSYDFPGKSKEQLFTAALAVLKVQGYDIESSNKYDWTIKTWDLRLPLGEGDCNCSTDHDIVYYKTGNTTTDVVLTVKVSEGKIVIKAEVTRKFVTPDPAYGDRFYCVSKGTVENDVFLKIAAQLRGGF